MALEEDSVERPAEVRDFADASLSDPAVERFECWRREVIKQYLDNPRFDRHRGHASQQHGQDERLPAWLFPPPKPPARQNQQVPPRVGILIGGRQAMADSQSPASHDDDPQQQDRGRHERSGRPWPPLLTVPRHGRGHEQDRKHNHPNWDVKTN